MANTRILSSAALAATLLLAACGEAAPTATTGAGPANTTAPATATATNGPAATQAATATTGPLTTPGENTGTPGANLPLTRVRLALDWTPNTNHTGFYVALQKGWYKEQGIDLQILPYSDAASPDTLVSTGQAEFAISFLEQVVLDRVNGMPVKSVAALVQHNTSELVTRKDSGLDRPAKLEGKRYAGFGTPYEEPVIGDMIRHDGGKTGAFQNVTANTGGLQALETKQVDFVWIYKGWEAIQAKHDGVDLNEFLISDFGVPDYPSPVLIANESFIKDQADLGKRFLAATAKGYALAISDPKQAADLLIKANPPDAFPDKPLVQESAAYLATQYQAEAPRWGEQTLAMWSGYPKFMLETGKLEDQNHQKVTSLDYAAMFSNDLLPAK